MSAAWAMTETVTYLAGLDGGSRQTFGEEMQGMTITMVVSVVTLLLAVGMIVLSFSVEDTTGNTRLGVTAGWFVCFVLLFPCTGRLFSETGSTKLLVALIVVFAAAAVIVARVGKRETRIAARYDTAAGYIGVVVTLAVFVGVLIYRLVKVWFA